MNYWYAPLPNEMFLDLDSKAALLRAMRVLHVWMKDYKKYDLPPIEAVYNYPTSHRDGRYHAHVIVVFRSGLRFLTLEVRTRWALWMGSDARRACYVLERIDRNLQKWDDMSIPVMASDLLVSRRKYYRPANEICKCPPKHKDRKVTQKCSALKTLLGPERSADYFPRVGPGKIPALQIPVGEIPLQVIRQWRSDGKKRL